MNFSFQNIINPDLKNFIDEKMNSFIEYIKNIIPENKKEKFEIDYNNLKSNYFKIMMFIIFLNENNTDENIQEFMNKFDINNDNYDKIKEYYT